MDNDWGIDFSTKVYFHMGIEDSNTQGYEKRHLNDLFTKIAGSLREFGREGQLIIGHGKGFNDEQLQNAVAILEENGYRVHCLRSVGPGAATLEQIYDYTEQFRSNPSSWILSIGGGGVIDLAKILSVTAGLDNLPVITSSFDTLIETVSKTNEIPVVSVPTCLGSGAEVSNLAEIHVEKDRVQRPMIGDNLYPKKAFISPYLCRGVPSHIQVSSIIDALAHLLDPLFSIVETESWPQAEISILLAQQLVNLSNQIFQTPLDLSVLANIAWISHMAVKPGIGRLPCPSVIHRIEHAFSPVVGVTHGEGLAILLPSFIKELETICPAAWRSIATILPRVFGRNTMPDKLFRHWLSGLPFSMPIVDAPVFEVQSIARSSIDIFADSDCLPGSLELREKDVVQIVQGAITNFNVNVIEKSRIGCGLNSKRVFGGPIAGNWDYVLLTPIVGVFKAICKLINAIPRKGWVQSASAHVQNQNILMIFAHPGGVNSLDALDFSLQAGAKFNKLIFLGYGGALRKSMKVGTRIIPFHATDKLEMVSKYLESHVNLPKWSIHNKWPIEKGVVFSVDRLSRENKDFLDLLQKTGFDIVDMETNVVFTWCRKNDVLLETVLVVSDHPGLGSPIWKQPDMSKKAINSMQDLVEDFIRKLG